MTNTSPTKTLPFTTVEQGQMTGATEATVGVHQVVKDVTDWARLWQRHTSNVCPKPALPEILFADKMVIAAFAGSRSSGGHSIEIVKVEDTGAEIVVSLKQHSPGRGMFSACVMTSPFHFVSVERSEKPVKFQAA